MKNYCGLILGLMVCANLLAQPTTPPPAPLAETPGKAEKKKTAPKKVAPKPAPAEKKTALAEKPIVLSPGAATINASNVNVRGQARLNSEIVRRFTKGDAVTVIEQVILDNPKADEPAQWAKIAFPAGANVWVHSSYIDAASKVVIPKRLNVRTGPGENYSRVGLIEKGTAVKEVSAKGSWIEIEPPAGAYAFVAAMYLKQEMAAPAVPPIVSIAPPEQQTKPVTAAVPEPQVVAPPPTTPPTTTPATTPAEPTPTPVVTPAPAPEAAPPPAEDEPPPKRVVSHEGVVKNTWSIQAPTPYALVNPETGRTINYLYSTSTNLNLRPYKGLHIIVTGEEGLDERWKNTPVITIQRIQVVE